MRKPTLKKAGFLWSCAGAGLIAKGKTPASAYSNWFGKVDGEMVSLLKQQQEARRRAANDYARYTASLEEFKAHYEKNVEALKKQTETTPSEKIPDAWIARRIQFYNQRCIEYIWATGLLPSEAQYMEWTGRYDRDDPVRK
jgi:hypothetical protein